MFSSVQISSVSLSSLQRLDQAPADLDFRLDLSLRSSLTFLLRPRLRCTLGWLATLYLRSSSFASSLASPLVVSRPSKSSASERSARIPKSSVSSVFSLLTSIPLVAESFLFSRHQLRSSPRFWSHLARRISSLWSSPRLESYRELLQSDHPQRNDDAVLWSWLRVSGLVLPLAVLVSDSKLTSPLVASRRSFLLRFFVASPGCWFGRNEGKLAGLSE